MTDKDMVELVCEAIQFRGLAQSNDASDWGIHQAQCDWVRAMQKQNEALKEMVAAQKERIEALSRISSRYSAPE